MCRLLGLLWLLALSFSLTTFSASAGTLSQARSEARDEDRRNSGDGHRESSGTLSAARVEVRGKERHEERHDDRQRDRRRRDRSRDACLPACGSIGWFAYSQPCPPPVVETVVVTQPVYMVEPTDAAPPTYIEPLGPSLAAAFDRQFAPYPYANQSHGFMLVGSPGAGQSWSGRIGVERGSDFDDLGRTGFSFLLEGEGGLGIDFDWDSYTEDLAGGGHDEMHVGEVDLLYRFVENEQLLFRAGLGVAWLGDAYDTNAGINFTLKADYAPCDPLVLSGELDLGTLGDAEHLHAAGTAGVMIHRCEVYGGYDYRRIGDVEIQGPMVGLRIWF
jgi:hypothetical protein